MANIIFPVGTRLMAFTCPICDDRTLDWNEIVINLDSPMENAKAATYYVIVSNMEEIKPSGNDYVVEKPLIAMRDIITIKNKEYVFGYALAYDREEIREMLKSYNFRGGL